MGSNIDHPDHYGSGDYETIKVIDAWGLDFSLGNAVKYISRAGKKDGATKEEDLKKAIWYLQHEIGESDTKEEVKAPSRSLAMMKDIVALIEEYYNTDDKGNPDFAYGTIHAILEVLRENGVRVHITGPAPTAPIKKKAYRDACKRINDRIIAYTDDTPNNSYEKSVHCILEIKQILEDEGVWKR